MKENINSTKIKQILPFNSKDTIWLVLNILPIVLAVLFVIIWSQNVPYKHDWIFLKHILGYPPADWLSNFWRPQNGQRNIIPQLIYLFVYYAFNFNTLVILYLNLIVLLVSYVIIRKIFHEELNISWRSFLPVSWLFFSLVQYGNFLVTWQISLNLSIMASLLSFYLLGKKDLKPFVFSILFAVVSIGSFGNGLVVLPVGLIYLLTNGAKKKRIIYWAVFSIAVIGIYFFDYNRAGVSPPLNLVNITLFFTNLLSMATLLPFGRIGGGVYVISAIMGSLIALSALFQFSKYFWFIKSKGFFSIITLLFMYVTGILVQITIGRAGGGIEGAYGSQYTSFVILFIIFLYGFLLLSAKATLNTFIGVWLNRISRSILFVVIILTIFIGDSFGFIMGPYLYGRTLVEKNILFSFDHHPDDIKRLVTGGSSADISHWISILHKEGKSIFEDKDDKQDVLLLPYLESAPLRTKTKSGNSLTDSATYSLNNLLNEISNVSIRTKIASPSPNDYLKITIKNGNDMLFSKSISSEYTFTNGRVYTEVSPPIDLSVFRDIHISVSKKGNTISIPLFKPYYSGPLCIYEIHSNANCLVPGIEINTPVRLKYFYLVDALRNRVKYFVFRKTN